MAGTAPKGSTLLINRDFTLLWAGQTISSLGDIVFDLTLILWITTRIAHDRPWAAFAVSGVLVAASIPTLVVGPVAGVFVDRWNKRRTMLATDALRGILITVLFLTSGVWPLSALHPGTLPAVWQLVDIYVIVTLSSTCGQFFGPARLALIGDLVPEPDRTRASSRTQVTVSLALIVGPAIAAPLFFGLGVQWALVINALSYLVSFLALWAIQAPPAASSRAAGQPGQLFGEFVAGLRFFLGNRVLLTMLIAIAVAVLGFGALNALNIFFVTQNLHAPAQAFGFTTTAIGVGAVVGAALTSLVTARLGVVRTFWLSELGLGIVVLVYARLTSLAPALVVLGMGGVLNAAASITIMPILLHVTPREFLGRMNGVLTPVTTAASLLSITLAGFLDSTILHGLHTTLFGVTWGPVDTIFMGTGVLTVAGGCFAMINLWGVTLTKDTAAIAVPVAD